MCKGAKNPPSACSVWFILRDWLDISSFHGGIDWQQMRVIVGTMSKIDLIIFGVGRGSSTLLGLVKSSRIPLGYWPDRLADRTAGVGLEDLFGLVFPLSEALACHTRGESLQYSTLKAHPSSALLHATCVRTSSLRRIRQQDMADSRPSIPAIHKPGLLQPRLLTLRHHHMAAPPLQHLRQRYSTSQDLSAWL